jgi:hypothetical protein
MINGCGHPFYGGEARFETVSAAASDDEDSDGAARRPYQDDIDDRVTE